MAEATKDERSYAIRMPQGNWLIIRWKRPRNGAHTAESELDLVQSARVMWLTRR